MWGRNGESTVVEVEKPSPLLLDASPKDLMAILSAAVNLPTLIPCHFVKIKISHPCIYMIALIKNEIKKWVNDETLFHSCRDSIILYPILITI